MTWGERIDGRRVLLGATVLLPVVPLMRVPFGEVPLYVVDVLLLALAVAFLRPGRLPPGARALLWWGLAFLLSTVPSVLIALFAYDEPLFTVYYWARRVLALGSFGTFLVLFSAAPEPRRIVVRALLAGLVLTSTWCLVQVLTRSTGVVGVLDRFYYVVLGQAVRELPLDRWEAAWKVPRAIAGWWNPNVTGAALALLLCLVPGHRGSLGSALLIAAAGLALLTTASRQALIAAAVSVGTLLVWPSVRRAGWAGNGGVLVGVALAGAAAFGFASDQLARAVGDVEGGIGEGVGSRLDNYPAFWDALTAASPMGFLFGHGAEGSALLGRSGGLPDLSAFVSNTLLLTLGENGFLSFALLIGFLVAVLRRARAPWQRATVVVALWLLNCDNHLYLFPPLMALLCASLALAATPPPREVTA